MKRRQIYASVVGAMIVLLVIVALQNMHDVELKALAWSFSVPLVVLLPAMALFGAVIAAIVGAIRRRARRRRAERELQSARDAY